VKDAILRCEPLHSSTRPFARVTNGVDVGAMGGGVSGSPHPMHAEYMDDRQHPIAKTTSLGVGTLPLIVTAKREDSLTDITRMLPATDEEAVNTIQVPP
jgi:hypothetical protein